MRVVENYFLGILGWGGLKPYMMPVLAPFCWVRKDRH